MATVDSRPNTSTSSPRVQGPSETSQPLKGPLFPLSYKEGLSQWRSAISPAAAEAAVLNFLPFNHPAPATSSTDPHTTATTDPASADPYGPRQCSSTLVKLSGKDRALNEFSITRTGEPPAENHIVMIHGYGAGLAFFYRNFDALSRLPGWKLWSLDLLGYGRSSRPKFTISSKDPAAKIEEAEDWFIDALEEWRQERGIERFTLLGHSLGGYLSMRYTLKYPTRVNKLIMASPVGVPEDPWSVRATLPESHSNPELGTATLPPADSSTNTLPDERDAAATKSNRPRRAIPKWIECLWDANVSPFSFIRWSGPLGPRLVSGWSTRRFASLPEDEAKALHDYSYSLFRQRGSGEYALAYILAPGAFARSPLLWRVQDLAKKVGPGGIPSVWMYGDMDWMDSAGGFAAEEKIRNTEVGDEGSYVGGEEWRGENKGKGGEAKVLIVKNAGHHLYLDAWEEFNGMIVKELKDVEVREKSRKERN